MFYLLGINTLIPWSFFITADDVSDDVSLLFFSFAENTVVYITSFFSTGCINLEKFTIIRQILLIRMQNYLNRRQIFKLVLLLI